MTPADSDHWPFQHLGVPYIFFYTGEHPDYHAVGDEPARTDADKACRVARLAFYTVEAIANDRTPPAWDPESRRLNVTSPSLLVLVQLGHNVPAVNPCRFDDSGFVLDGRQYPTAIGGVGASNSAGRNDRCSQMGSARDSPGAPAPPARTGRPEQLR